MTKSLSLVFIALLTTGSCFSQSSLSCTEYKDYMLTCELTPAGPIPTVFDPNGVYPYVSYVEPQTGLCSKNIDL